MSSDLCPARSPLPSPSHLVESEFAFGHAFDSTLRKLFEKLETIDASQRLLQSSLQQINDRLACLSIATQAESKQWYTPSEVAELVGKKVYTVREWCRYRRIDARKRCIGRGAAEEWEVSADEIERYRNHGLLPIPLKY